MTTPQIPLYIYRKILLYNSHPVADLLQKACIKYQEYCKTSWIKSPKMRMSFFNFVKFYDLF